MKKIEKLKRVGSILYDDDDIHASDSPATVLADKLDELIDWQNEMVELIKWSEVHMKPFTVEANTPQEDTTPSNDHFRKATKMIEPHTSDTSFRGAVVETVNKFLDDCNLVEASWCEEHKDGLHATVTIGEAHSIVDAIVKLAEEHYGSEAS